MYSDLAPLSLSLHVHGNGCPETLLDEKLRDVKPLLSISVTNNNICAAVFVAYSILISRIVARSEPFIVYRWSAHRMWQSWTNPIRKLRIIEYRIESSKNKTNKSPESHMVAQHWPYGLRFSVAENVLCRTLNGYRGTRFGLGVRATVLFLLCSTDSVIDDVIVVCACGRTVVAMDKRTITNCFRTFGFNYFKC